MFLVLAAKQALHFSKALESAASPSLLVSWHSFDVTAPVVQKNNEPRPPVFSFFFFPSSGVFWSVFAARRMHTHFGAQADSLKIVTHGTA